MGSEDLERRHAFAEEITKIVRGLSPEIQKAFAEVPRERFVGKGPWYLLSSTSNLDYVLTPSTDLAHIYQDVLIAIDKEKLINNGLPSWQALNFKTMGVRKGEHVTHIGAGVGYYTALLAEIVGDEGAVFGVEYEEELAEQAMHNLRAYENVTLLSGDGSNCPLPPSDIVYVNAGACELQKTWVEALKEGGRLFFPLVYDMRSKGRMVLIHKQNGIFSVSFTHDVYVYPCIGSNDAAKRERLKDVFELKGYEFTGELCFDPDNADSSCYLVDDWYWLKRER